VESDVATADVNVRLANLRITVHGPNVRTTVKPDDSETWEGIRSLLALGFRVSIVEHDS
jgi:hypothetical protein